MALKSRFLWWLSAWIQLFQNITTIVTFGLWIPGWRATKYLASLMTREMYSDVAYCKRQMRRTDNILGRICTIAQTELSPIERPPQTIEALHRIIREIQDFSWSEER